MSGRRKNIEERKNRNRNIAKKVYRDNLFYVKHLQIPPRNNTIRPVVEVCSKCGKNNVTHHHFYCDSCWIKEQKLKIEKSKNIKNKTKIISIQTKNNKDTIELTQNV